MTRRRVDPSKSPVVDAAVEASTPLDSPPPPLRSDLSIDALLDKGLTLIWGTLRAVQNEVATGAPSREAVMNLKDCMLMLHQLKEKEDAILDAMSDDELEAELKKRANES